MSQILRKVNFDRQPLQDDLICLGNWVDAATWITRYCSTPVLIGHSLALTGDRIYGDEQTAIKKQLRKFLKQGTYLHEIVINGGVNEIQAEMAQYGVDQLSRYDARILLNNIPIFDIMTIKFRGLHDPDVVLLGMSGFSSHGTRFYLSEGLDTTNNMTNYFWQLYKAATPVMNPAPKQPAPQSRWQRLLAAIKPK